MIKAFKYRIYPTPEQAITINKTIGVARFIYNLALETRIRAWQSFGVRLSVYELQKQLTEVREQYDWVREVCVDAPHEAIKNIDLAFSGFFNGKGFPRFKSKKDSGAYCARTGTKKIHFDTGLIDCPKMPKVKAIITRRFEGDIKVMYISRTATKKYFATFIVNTKEEVPALPEIQTAIGVDLGIKDFATLSTGKKIANPRHLQPELRRLKVLQRRVSRKKKDSKNRAKANLRVALLHEKISNQRQDFLHKLSSKLIGDNQTDTICIEDLAVKNLVRNHSLAQSISDVSWSEFVRQLEYKGRWYGKNVIKIDRFYASSKICSNCGHKYDELNLSERTWQCSVCGTTHDRDINAAINIRNSGMGNAGEPAELSAVAEAKKQEQTPIPEIKFLTQQLKTQ